MKSSFKNSFLNKTVVLYLCMAILLIGAFPADLFAMFLSSSSPAEANPFSMFSANREHDIKNVQKILETKLLQQRLKDLGLTAEQISSRISQLTDAQLHQISSKIDSMQTGGGGDGLGVIIALLVIAILVVVLLQVSGHKVIITR
ncbi:MAG: PA2779 family protein [Nitrospirae bacterium]|nr:PA2779 family protein [Nitrospirota bacterium]MBI3353175.1 PA2779 family protein [Nitrospirota bacterium]